MRTDGNRAGTIERISTGSTSLGKRLYTLPELLRLTGMTRKQATYWAQTGLLVPTLSDPNAATGKPAHFYSARDVVKALIVCDIRRAGFSHRQVQLIANNLDSNGIRLDDVESYLLTDGYSVYHADTNNEVVDILKHHRQMLFLVPIHDQVAKLRRSA